MRRALIALCIFILSACSGSGSMIRPIGDRAPTIYIEPMPGDGHGIAPELEALLIRLGYDPVSDPSRAAMRLYASYVFDPYNLRATVRISDANTGDNIYRGEGKNRGFGTLVNPSSSILGAFERALSDLPPR